MRHLIYNRWVFAVIAVASAAITGLLVYRFVLLGIQFNFIGMIHVLAALLSLIVTLLTGTMFADLTLRRPLKMSNRDKQS